MTKVIPLTITILSFALIAGCIQQKQDMAADSEAIDELYRTFNDAYQSHDAGLVASLYNEDARYLEPNPELAIREGRASIRETFSGFMEWAGQNNRDLRIQFRILEREISGDLAYDTGYYLLQSKPDSVEAFGNEGGVGKFVTVMGRQPDGSWKFLLDGFSPAPYRAYAESDSAGAHNPFTD